MLPACHRLRRPDQFREVGRRGVRAGRNTLVVHLEVIGDEAPALVGFTVGRAVGSAVVRNQVRRRLRHAAGDLLRAGSASALHAGDRVVVRASPAAASSSYAVLRDDLREALDRARARSRPSARST